MCFTDSFKEEELITCHGTVVYEQLSCNSHELAQFTKGEKTRKAPYKIPMKSIKCCVLGLLCNKESSFDLKEYFINGSKQLVSFGTYCSPSGQLQNLELKLYYCRSNRVTGKASNVRKFIKHFFKNRYQYKHRTLFFSSRMRYIHIGQLAFSAYKN